MSRMSDTDGSMAETGGQPQQGDDEAEILLNLGPGAEPVNGDQEEADPETEDLVDEQREHGQGDQVNTEAIKSLADVLTRQLQMMQQQFQEMRTREVDAQTELAEVRQQAERRREQPDNNSTRAKMMTFDGTTPWLEYEAYLEEYGKALRWTDARKAQNLCLSLRGSALGILLSLQPEQREDFAEVKSALRQHFCPAEKVFVYQAELQARRLQDGENLAELARDIRTKTRLAYPEADNKTLETLMKQYFVSSLADKEQRLSVSKSHPRTLTQAMAYATEYESIMKTEEVRPGERKRIRRTQDEAVEQEPKLADLLAKLEGLEKKLEKKENFRRPPRDKTQVKCYACQEMGHFARECPQEEATSGAGPTNSGKE